MNTPVCAKGIFQAAVFVSSVNTHFVFKVVWEQTFPLKNTYLSKGTHLQFESDLMGTSFTIESELEKLLLELIGVGEKKANNQCCSWESQSPGKNSKSFEATGKEGLESFDTRGDCFAALSQSALLSYSPF